MFKKLIIPMIAVIAAVGLAFGTSDFDKKEVLKPLNMATFDYVMINGDQEDPDDRIDPNNYQRQSSTLSCPSGTTQFCKINAPDDGTVNHKPIISGALESALVNGRQPLPAALANEVWLKP